MIFNDFLFMISFSIFLMIYWSLKNEWKSFGLIIFNMLFIFTYGIYPVLLISLSALINFLFIRKNYLKLALTFNLIFLLGFKFFIPHNFLLTIGLSYYTFNLISYIVDIQRGILTSVEKFSDHFLYVTFFPGFLAGPLNRAKNFFSDLELLKSRQNELGEGNRAVSFLLLFLWGYFKKSYCGDWINIYYTSEIFSHLPDYHSLTIISAVFFYVLEIYFDFSGYSLMARAVAGLLGFDIPHNFNYPFLAKSMTEFWNRWHITLSLWLRDYLYYPLRLKMQTLSPPLVIIASTLITWVTAGLWHGKGWVFFFYGLLQGVFITIHQLWKYYENLRLKKMNIKRVPSENQLGSLASIVFTFALFSYSMILFRSSSMDEFIVINQAILNQFQAGLKHYLPAHLLLFFTIVILEHLWGKYSFSLRWQKYGVWTKGLAAGFIILYVFLVAPKNFIQFIYFKY